MKDRQNRQKAASNGETFHVNVISDANVAESIFSDKFTTGNRIDALTAHAQTLLSCLKQTALDRLRVRLNIILLFMLSIKIHALNIIPAGIFSG